MTLRPGQQVIWHKALSQGGRINIRAIVVGVTKKRVHIRAQDGVRRTVMPERLSAA